MQTRHCLGFDILADDDETSIWLEIDYRFGGDIWVPLYPMNLTILFVPVVYNRVYS